MKSTTLFVLAALCFPSGLFAELSIEPAVRFGSIDLGSGSVFDAKRIKRNVTSPEISLFGTVGAGDAHELGVTYIYSRWKDSVSGGAGIPESWQNREALHTVMVDYRYSRKLTDSLSVFVSPKAGFGTLCSSSDVTRTPAGGEPFTVHDNPRSTGFACEAEVGITYAVAPNMRLKAGVAYSIIDLDEPGHTNLTWTRTLEGVVGASFRF